MTSPEGALPAGLVPVRASPFNAESAPGGLDAILTRTDDFYVRSNFPVPTIDPAAWRLEVGGFVERPLTLSLDELVALPRRTVAVTLECAGNGRARLSPLPEGEPWDLGAVSTAEFTGVPLDHVLGLSGIEPGAVDVRFEGTDRGIPRGGTETIGFERSLPVADALSSGALLVHTMNGRALTADHGAPLRVIVPGWYGMAAVKWLRRIEVIDRPLVAHYQTRQYRYYEESAAEGPPVREMRVKSLVTSVAPGSVLRPGPHEIRGAAWCGTAPITGVEVSVDAGAWRPAELLGDPLPHAWRRWRFDWDGGPPGRHSIRSRASAADGSSQPDRPAWNRLGYGNNAVVVTLVTVR